MKKELISSVIGKLTQDDEFDDWWLSDDIEIPFFDNRKIQVTYSDFTPEEDKTFLSEADKAIGFFLSKGKNDRALISELVFQNCMDFLNAIGYEEEDDKLWNIKDAHEIWKYVYPKDIYVERRPYNEKGIYVKVTCECEWEREHGLQIVFRQGKQVTRVSQQDGHLTKADAYDIPDEEDELLSRFKLT